MEDNVDQNLGYEVWRDGEYLGRNLSGVEVDTSLPAEHSIDYVAKDQAGNIATSTRMVIVEGAVLGPTTETALTEPEPTLTPTPEPAPDIPSPVEGEPTAP